MKTQIEKNVDYSLKIVALIMMLFVILALTSCTTSKKTTSETVKKDSVRIEYKEKIVYKDSLIETIIPADKELLKIYFECDSLGKIQMKQIEQLEAGKNVKAKIQVRDNVIYVDCEVDTFLVYSIYKSRFESISSDITNDSVFIDKSTEKKRSLPWWFYLSIIGSCAGGVVIGFVLKRIIG